MHIQSLFPFYLLVALPHVLGQDNRNPVLNDKTDAFINQVLADWRSPGGVAVAVVRRDGLGAWNIETRGYGKATINGTKVTEKTLFGIGSNSKLFNVLATGLLINNETLSPRLSWTTKIASVVPIWGLADSTASKEATILDVMSHRTGLPRHDYSYKWSDDVPTVIKKLKFQRPSAEFRDVFQYNNNMYTLLSYLPTVLLPSKVPLARYVKQHIFDPLAMTSTTYSFEVANSGGQLADGMVRQVTNVSDPFGGIPRAMPYWSVTGGEDGNVLSGAAGVISNAAIWLQTLLLDGTKPGTNQSVIPAAALQRVSAGITVEVAAARFPELSPVVYGGGQARSTYRGHEIIKHDGAVPGFHTQITRLPFDDLGVAVLTNDNDYGNLIMEVIKGNLLDEALGLEKIDWNSRYQALVSTPLVPATPRPPNSPLPSVNFTSLAGTYNSGGYGKFELCLVKPHAPSASSSCMALAANISSILPGAINTNIPTFIGTWDSPWLSHVRLTHFSGNLFNVSALTSLPTGNASAPYWAYGDSVTDFGAYAEFVVSSRRHIGLGFTGIWGAESSLKGGPARERAEVWFDKA
ncbi:Gigasin-6 [Hypsizygus marmoreus]|uniref:Gigasin-6 n=1 Tax=Hypsizygus marmoreus TaxID=39966 RepID=A0A369K5U9_HYPMA|nr:Gigasin-6 [Hypsizygus marmoreus]